MILAYFLLAAHPVVGSEGFAPSFVTLEGDNSRVAIRHANQDDRLDLIQVEPTGFGFKYQLVDGTFSPAFDAYLRWPTDHLAWDIVDIDGDEVHEVVTLASSGEVRAWRPDAEGQFGEGQLLIASKSYLPHGISRMRFVRDVDSNGRADLVLPAAGQFRIHLQGTDGSWDQTLEIEYEAEIDYSMGDPESLDSEFGQSLRIPWFSMEDVTGDGNVDLVSRTDERVDFHLGEPEFSATPTWTLNLMGDETRASRESKGVDLDDLFSNIDQGVKWRIEDVDGKPPLDLILQEGRTLKLYNGGSTTGVDRRPDQVLKISGNMLHFFIREVTGDSLPELQILRAEQVGIGQVIRWFILPGSLDFEFFTYENRKGLFSRKPTRRNVLSLKIPRLLSLIEDVEGIEEEFDRQRDIPARRLDLGGDGLDNDVVDLVGGKVRFFKDCAPVENEKLASLNSGSLETILDTFLLKDLDRLEADETRTIDLGGYASWSFSPGAALRESTKGQKVELEVPGLGTEGKFEMQVLDMNGDGRDDVIAWTRLESGESLIQFLVRPKGQ